MSCNDRDLRRFALDLARQLPDDPEDARKVLLYCQMLLIDFINPGGQQKNYADRVVTFRGTGTASSLANR